MCGVVLARRTERATERCEGVSVSPPHPDFGGVPPLESVMRAVPHTMLRRCVGASAVGICSSPYPTAGLCIVYTRACSASRGRPVVSPTMSNIRSSSVDSVRHAATRQLRGRSPGRPPCTVTPPTDMCAPTGNTWSPLFSVCLRMRHAHGRAFLICRALSGLCDPRRIGCCSGRLAQADPTASHGQAVNSAEVVRAYSARPLPHGPAVHPLWAHRGLGGHVTIAPTHV